MNCNLTVKVIRTLEKCEEDEAERQDREEKVYLGNCNQLTEPSEVFQSVL